MQKAIRYYEQALVISREIDDRRGEGNHLGSLGNAYADFMRQQFRAVAAAMGIMAQRENRTVFWDKDKESVVLS